MKTFITTAHEEKYSVNGKILGVLLNFNDENNRVDSLTYIFHRKTYIFFNTIIEMNDYLLYSDFNTKRAYLSEEDFDKIYDASHINGKFSDQLSWTTEPSKLAQ
jgi:hypothetical protein